jgi:hypothetical protein
VENKTMKTRHKNFLLSIANSFCFFALKLKNKGF